MAALVSSRRLKIKNSINRIGCKICLDRMRPIRLSPGGRIYVVVFPLYFNVCMMFSKEEMFKTEACWIDNRCHYTAAVKSFYCISAVSLCHSVSFICFGNI